MHSEGVEHFGMCDASAAVAAGRTMFLVANDEDNVLRVYRNSTSGKPVQTFDLTSFLKPDPAHPEADIEGATQVGERVYWITSHGTNKNGKPRPSRHRLFATEVKIDGHNVTIVPVGTPYKNLVQDFTSAPQLNGFNLADAAGKPPEEGGLNIEGLSATPDGALLIAFRSPVPDGKALIVPLQNPEEVIDGKKAKLGAPIQLPLGGLGIRSIDFSQVLGKYLIIAGRPDNLREFRLYQWSGVASDAPEPFEGIQFKGLNPEALIIYPEEKTKVQVLGDDGSKQVDGMDCKDAPPEKRRFRSRWLALEP